MIFPGFPGVLSFFSGFPGRVGNLGLLKTTQRYWVQENSEKSECRNYTGNTVMTSSYRLDEIKFAA